MSKPLTEGGHVISMTRHIEDETLVMPRLDEGSDSHREESGSQDASAPKPSVRQVGCVADAFCDADS